LSRPSSASYLPSPGRELPTTAIELGKFFNVEKSVVYDQTQKKVVPSQELENSVKNFQYKKKLQISGKIDVPTLEAASGTSTAELLKK
jgi:hypothetical protein